MDKPDYMGKTEVNDKCENLQTSSQKESITTPCRNSEHEIRKDPEEKQERQTTQTDHINKKLLGAFLERLNQNDNSISFGIKAQYENDDDSDFVDQTDTLKIDS